MPTFPPTYFRTVIYTWLLTCISFSLLGQKKPLHTSQTLQLDWQNQAIWVHPESPIIPLFQNAHWDEQSIFPYYPLSSPESGNFQFQVHQSRYEPMRQDEQSLMDAFFGKQTIQEEIHISSGIFRGQVNQNIKIYPYRKNENGTWEKLNSLSYQWIPSAKQSQIQQTSDFASASILKEGKLWRFPICKDGVYKIDSAFLARAGVLPEEMVLSSIQLFGNGGRILPEANAQYRPDDLQEIPSKLVNHNGDNLLNGTEYLTFYAKGSLHWDYKPLVNNGMTYLPARHFYSDSSFYFIRIGAGTRKETASIPTENATANYTTTAYDDQFLHENNQANLIHSGREMYGESFENSDDLSFPFYVPEPESDTIGVKASIAGRNFSTPSNYTVSGGINGVNIICNATGSSFNSDLATEGANSGKIQVLFVGDTLTIHIHKNTSTAYAWLNYLVLNVRKKLSFRDRALVFSDARTISPGRISTFLINTASDIEIWDITNFNTPKIQEHTFLNQELSFNRHTDSLLQFIGFRPEDIQIPEKAIPIPNQNLHAQSPAEYLIICPPAFYSQAKSIGELHEVEDSLTFQVATTNEIFNEFSSGSVDPVAIRDYIRMHYSRSLPEKKTKYVLLFGDGSFDNRNYTNSSNSALIPTYETYNSLSFKNSYTSDDFFAMMDNAEGTLGANDYMDLAVGRIPILTIQQANEQVEKTRNYYRKGSCKDLPNGVTRTGSYGDWRNRVTFVSDDADAAWETTFISGSENFSTIVRNTNPSINVEKIYADSYMQTTSTGGEHYPDVSKAIDNTLKNGTLVLNYSGHGGETGWGSERHLEVGQILQWENSYTLPMFLTATCEFSRYDDPQRVSAGELVLLNAKGGAIGLFTTTRIAYSVDAGNLCPVFFNNLFAPQADGSMPHMGDLILKTKAGTNQSYRNFTLLGDPAIHLAYPKYKIITDSILVNGSMSDTIKALQEVTVKGHLLNADELPDVEFTGTILPQVYDKRMTITTNGNNIGNSGKINFTVQKNILYKGVIPVEQGKFQFTFFVPKDILYTFGRGKISYYAFNEIHDASGYQDSVIIGGLDTLAGLDNTPPEIKLYMDKPSFKDGDFTLSNPTLHANLFDSSGINYLNNGLGHEITAYLDNKPDQLIRLNDLFQSDANTYQSGKITLPFSDLSIGPHEITLKAWDNQNNPATAKVGFTVTEHQELAIRKVFNYPNPFTSKTLFHVEHNNPFQTVYIQIQIFTISGKAVKTIETTVGSQQTLTEGVLWDGKDDFGDRLARGVYLYRVKIKNDKGQSVEKMEKLVILN